MRGRVRQVTGLAAPGNQPALLTGERDDWDASAWDPEIQRDIERRRRAHQAPGAET